MQFLRYLMVVQVVLVAVITNDVSCQEDTLGYFSFVASCFGQCRG